MSSKKNSDTPTFDDAFYRVIELTNGSQVKIQAWGIAEVRANFSVLQEIFNDLLNLDDKTQKKIASDPKAFSDFVDKQFNRFTALIEASLTDDSAPLSEVRGLDNLIALVEAVIEVNGLFRAVGKLTGLAERAASMMGNS